ncbi:MAG: hypothetical protein M1610_09760 [Nitrospirae bacterium]|nr:hypothetical protein [Nitrospirota bacterium]MCL5062635.1 hypothetical protein [Nitrospirota bacterium]MDA8339931.1 hypothetical protein [Nitrospiraceae bacterium]
MIKYLCIDDEGAEVINPILANLSTAHNDLNIVHERPKNFSDQIEELQATMGQQKYHGLILDLRLDMFKSPEGEKANYRAFALAQEIRTRVTEGKLNDFPIVLCSVHTRIRRSYASDDTSHDLYDAVYEKENIPDNAAVIANELVSLVKGYRFIRKQLDGSRPPFYKMILADSEAGNALNPSVLSMFDKKRPVHEYARFILNELIRIPSPLIDERILVARLGIDIKKSTDWEKLKSALSRLSAY